MNFITIGGYDAFVDGVDETLPIMLHGFVLDDDGSRKRYIWFRNGRSVGGQEKYDKFDLPKIVISTEFPTFTLVKLDI